MKKKGRRRRDAPNETGPSEKPGAGGLLPSGPRASELDPSLERSWEGFVGAGGASRADLYIAEVARALSRSQIKARGARIFVGDKEVKPSRPLKEGDYLRVAWRDEPSPSLVPEDIELAILYEDERCLVVDKAQGMVVHPGAGNRRGTLANAVLGRLARERARVAVSKEGVDQPRIEEDRIEGPSSQTETSATRGGIVHRLDKDTSGLIIVAKDASTQAFLASQFKEREAKKEYLAIVRGLPEPPSGRIENRLGRDRRDRKLFAQVESGGRIAVTDYRVLLSWGPGLRGERYALVSLKPRTGRTHQLRVHMAGMGTSILGDPLYGSRDAAFPQATLMLHAYTLRIRLSTTGAPSSFRAPIPARFSDTIRTLRRAFGSGERPALVSSRASPHP